jgi:putative DNA primase/helicase
MRGKWDSKRGAQTYGQITIERAIELTQDVYDPTHAQSDAIRAAMDAAQSLQPNGGAVWLPSGDVIEALGRGEMGDAELLARLFADQICFDHAEDKWFLYRGHNWQTDRRDEVVGLVANAVAAQYLYVAAQKRKDGNPELADTLTDRAKLLRYRNKINNVLTLAKSQTALALSGDEWDAKPMLLAVANGVLDLTTGDFRAGNPRDYVRTGAPTEWRGLNEPAERWEKFLSEIFAGDTALVGYVQRLLGYAITGAANEHAFPVLYGEGRNGKDTLLETFIAVLGGTEVCGFASPVSSDVLLDSGKNPNAPTPHLVALRGKRLCWVNESNEGARLNVSQVKQLTGGGTIVARPMYGDVITFKPQHLLMLVTNHKPRANADDYALWQRLVLIPFNQKFVENPSAPNEHARDTRLAEKLRGEASGILAWLVRGALEWQRQGLNPPMSVQSATSEYQADEDDISKFLVEKCVVDATMTPQPKTRGGELYEAYRLWAIGGGLSPMTGTKFGKRMSARFNKDTSTNYVIYVGVGLLP